MTNEAKTNFLCAYQKCELLQTQKDDFFNDLMAILLLFFSSHFYIKFQAKSHIWWIEEKSKEK